MLGLQALRALAALAVAVHHAQNEASLLAAHLGRSFEPSHALPWLAGVDVFFVISGFIMVHSSGPLFGVDGGRRLFLLRRLIRIVPLYWATTAAFLLLLAISPRVLNSPPPDLTQILTSLAFIPYPRPDGLVQPVYSLGWTLNFEMLFYMLFALAIGLPRRAAVACVAVLLGGLVVIGTIWAPLPQPFGFWAQPIVLEFALGMALGVVFGSAQAGGLWPGLTTLTPWARWALVVAALLLLHLDMPQHMPLPAPLTHFSGLVGYGIPGLLLVAAAVFGDDRARPPRFERLLAVLGDASYALYLVHPFALRLVRTAIIAAGLGLVVPAPVFMLLALLASVVLAVAVYRWFENPITRALRRSFKV